MLRVSISHEKKKDEANSNLEPLLRRCPGSRIPSPAEIQHVDTVFISRLAWPRFLLFRFHGTLTDETILL